MTVSMPDPDDKTTLPTPVLRQLSDSAPRRQTVASLREVIVDAMSWCEDMTQGRWGTNYASTVLATYERSVVESRVQLALSILGHRETTDGLSRDDTLLLRAALEGHDVLSGAA